jgi:SAM-dependent methyltransferase
MTEYELLVDLHKHGLRQGPGGEAETELALRLAMVDRTTPLKIADIGCGTGASALRLAKLLNARISAVDIFPEFLDVLKERAEIAGVADRISTIARSMDNLPFDDEELDVIWSEGAIYNVGFENGVKMWRRYMKAGGILVVSEITWTTSDRPRELQDHWDREYPEIDLASSKIRILEQQGYSPIGYFVLPEHCWLENYYRPMQARFEDFLNRNGNREEARRIVVAERREIELYERFKAYFSYGVYVARRLD